MSSPSLRVGYAAAPADSLQAVYYRGVLADEQAVLAAELAGVRKTLDRCLEASDLIAIRRTLQEIRAKEASYRDLDRLISALDERFGVKC